MRRRSFFKLGLTAVALGVVKPGRAARVFEGVITSPIQTLKPIVISTWEHGLAANDNAWKVLKANGSALDAVELGVRTTESDITNRSVGIGGRPDRDGHVTLDACIMDEKSNCGAVGCLEGIKHPISVARKIMENTPHIILVGDGAKSFALDYGFKHIRSPIKEVKQEWKNWKKENKELFEKPVINNENHDTIGMLALDANGNLSGACTTSGWGYKLPGRIGDSPIIGAGLFVDNEIGAACATGLGEAVIRIAGSHTVVELMRQGLTPQQACEEAVARIISKHENMEGLQVGFLALDKNGDYGAYSVFNGFNFAVKSNDQSELIDAENDRNW